jgi:GNAT superfamily N-acetyltransferase
MRADLPRAAGVRHERVGSVVRSSGLWNVVLYWQLSESDAVASVAEQAAWARSTGVELEWKVYGHDGPPGLANVLQDAGFVADPQETFMVFDLARELPDGAATDGLEIRQIIDAAGVDDLIAVGDAAFGRDHGAKAETYVRSLEDPALALYVAYRDGRAVSAGRLQMPEGRSFASMWGGGTTPEHRRQGIYRALVAHRAREARRRGYRYLTVDAASTSRPILKRLGFVPLTGITGYVLRP